MKDYPILFQGWGVRAILANQKTQTRRVIKPQPAEKGYSEIAPWCTGSPEHGYAYYRRGGMGCWESTKPIRCPYGLPGDRLWVRETWQDYCPLWHGQWCGHGTQEGIEKDHRPVYRAAPESEWLRPMNKKGDMAPPKKWKPSIHMPRWASRITLEVIDVRVERVQEIDEDNAKSEGVEWLPVGPDNSTNYVRSFADLWDSLNAKRGYGWETNPWVWVVEFKVLTPAGLKTLEG